MFVVNLTEFCELYLECNCRINLYNTSQVRGKFLRRLFYSTTLRKRGKQVITASYNTSIVDSLYSAYH
jgi:hypothetical protein